MFDKCSTEISDCVQQTQLAEQIRERSLLLVYSSRSSNSSERSWIRPQQSLLNATIRCIQKRNRSLRAQWALAFDWSIFLDLMEYANQIQELTKRSGDNYYIDCIIIVSICLFHTLHKCFQQEIQMTA